MGKSRDFKKTLASPVAKASIFAARDCELLEFRFLRGIQYQISEVSSPVSGIQPYLMFGNAKIVRPWIFGYRIKSPVSGISLGINRQETRLAA